MGQSSPRLRKSLERLDIGHEPDVKRRQFAHSIDSRHLILYLCAGGDQTQHEPSALLGGEADTSQTVTPFGRTMPVRTMGMSPLVESLD